MLLFTNILFVDTKYVGEVSSLFQMKITRAGVLELF